MSETLTFLFTDLEGSTRLWEQHGEAMRTALAHHDELLRTSVEAHGGRVVKSTGDGAMVVFGSAADAVDGAIAAQSTLYGAEWPDGVELRARMGLHTGEAIEREGDWFGVEVNRTARVMETAHGGQVVCTGAVAEQVGDRAKLMDLGEHRLRDLHTEVRIFQVEVPGAPTAFPPLQSLDAYRSNLPYELSSFVGRHEEVRTITERTLSARVQSIVGVGGVGKTRLALQAGSELLPHYTDGVWLCELAQVLDPGDLFDAIAAAVGYAPPQGVTVEEGLPRFLERKDLLLVLDNCEHLVAAVAAFVEDTTAHAARVSVLVTSREALGVQGEQISPLAPLGVPSAGDRASVVSSEAGALFVARSEEARGGRGLSDADADAVRQICVRLDGIPLAIELAAARTAMMTPTEIVEHLDHQFRLLTGGRRTSVERHQTLRAAIDWSYDLLTDDERAILNRLSVCVGGFDLDATVAVAAGLGVDEFEAFELIGSLVAKSLVERSEVGGSTRYRLLVMIRQYAAEQLEASGTIEATRDGHSRHYLALTTRLYAAANSPAGYEAIDRLEIETPNLGAAGRWLLETDRVGDLLAFLDDLPYVDLWALAPATASEIGSLATDAVERPDAAAWPGFVAGCAMAAVDAWRRGELAESAAKLELVGSGFEDQMTSGFTIELATKASYDGDLERSASLSEEAIRLARVEGDPARLAFVLAAGAVTVDNLIARRPEAVDPMDEAVAVNLIEEAVAVGRSVGDVAMLLPLSSLVRVTGHTDPQRALAAAEECIRLDRTRARSWSNLAQIYAAHVHVAEGQIVAGLEGWRVGLRQAERAGERSMLTGWLAELADALADLEPDAAIAIGAVAESDAIASYATFSTYPELVELARLRPDDVAAAIARASSMTYDEAVGEIDAVIDRFLAEHGVVGPEAL